MQVFQYSKSILDEVNKCLGPELRDFIGSHIERLKEYEEYGLNGLVDFVVCEECDSVADIDAVLGFPIMANRFDGVLFGEPGFQPSWEFVIEYKRWCEIVYVLGDDGAGVVVFVDKQGDPELVRMLRIYADRQ